LGLGWGKSGSTESRLAFSKKEPVGKNSSTATKGMRST